MAKIPRKKRRFVEAHREWDRAALAEKTELTLDQVEELLKRWPAKTAQPEGNALTPEEAKETNRQTTTARPSPG